jgi:hypothetical protein
MRFRTASVCAAMALSCSLLRAADIDFARDIRPILSDKCFQCHAADEASRQADLRLDLPDSALQDRGSGPAVVPGHPEQSELVRRITATDEAERMPPAEANKTLTPAQIELLREWVRQGAVYSEHWAFRPVETPAVPEVRQRDRVRNEIDAFILQGLEAAQLAPSHEADRATQIRRLYQDLLGLLPTPEEADAFIEDADPRAYDNLVARLLRSPHYGERWGRHWLDQARYADSHGYSIDGERVMWPYRDCVIQALNSDMPFDQFTIEQLAGDLLDNPTHAQLVATAFHRNTLINQEGGVKADQFRHEAIVDRVNTTGAVWLGLTVGCAQCHTHKFDPIAHDDYYRLYAFFGGCEDANNAGPTVSVLPGEMFGLTAEQRKAIAELPALRKQALDLESAATSAVAERLRSAGSDWHAVEFVSYRTAGNASFQKLPDSSLLTDGNATENDAYHVTFRAPLSEVTAVRLRVLPHESLPKQGPGTAGNGNFVLTDIELQVDDQPVRFIEAAADHEQPDYPVRHAIDGEGRTGWAINVGGNQRQQKPPPQMNAPHEAAFVLPQPLAAGDAQLTLVLRHDLNANYLIGRFAVDVTDASFPQDEQRPSSQLAVLRQRIAALEEIVPGRGQAATQMVMRDKPGPHTAFRLIRGDFLRPDQEAGPLAPGVPEALSRSRWPSGTPDSATTGTATRPVRQTGPAGPEFRNRLDLARWLVSRDNPLTARVAVNRVWMRYFGRGLVETENDFGYQGTPPSHPKLLDWLAATFMDRGWSLKELHRLIVTSATYRQASDVRADLAERDPDNRLLGRQPRLRVEAEIVRDLALSASGKLAPAVGGPSVFPPQPDGVYSFTQTRKNWTVSQGADRYRRTLYTMIYRSAPHPLLTTFDATDFSTTCTRRPRSDTPLQSLTLANDPMFFELAQALARRTLVETVAEPALEPRLLHMFRLCLTREPDPVERQLLGDYWRAEQERYVTDEDAARKLAPADGPADIAVSDAAAWTSLARVLLNTDEFVTRN